MNKETFLSNLETQLQDKLTDPNEIQDILNDYAMMIDEAIENGEYESDFIASLGSPEAIVGSIMEETDGQKTHVTHKLVAISPFIALIGFFASGFIFDAWHPGWVWFLFIPMSGIVFSGPQSLEKLVGFSVFLVLIGFFLGSFWLGTYDPLWALFLIIPGLGFFLRAHPIYKVAGIYTLSAVVIYIAYGLIMDPAHYYGLLLFLPVVLFGLMSGVITMNIDGLSRGEKHIKIFGTILSAFLIIIYVLIGYQYALWHPTWLIFLLIPISIMLYAQIAFKASIEIVAYTPFIALTIFFLWGHFANAYSYSWLIFLIIPISGILFETDDA